jgi:hypothetical protein
MIEKEILSISEIPDNFLANLETRDVALWIRGLPEAPIAQEKIFAFIGLPWRLVISEISDSKLVKILEDPSKDSEYMTRKRGFIQVVDSDPSRVQFPQRCLPIYLLKGRQETNTSADFEAQLRRLTMLEVLRRSMIREILVISGDCNPLPPSLKELWSSGFRSYLTFASDYDKAKDILEDWIEETSGVVSLSRLSAVQVIEDMLARYVASYPEDRRVIRVRDQKGSIYKLDVTEIDEPEHPILEHYSLILDRDLSPLQPEELKESDFISFFQNPEDSWRPYAAGLPWIRKSVWIDKLDRSLKKLNSGGSDENCVAYISSEAGAGGTTAARALAWRCARKGFPVLLAESVPFKPGSLEVSNFLLRAHRKIQRDKIYDHQTTDRFDSDQPNDRKSDPTSHPYEAPWIIVYDRLHWEYRDSELRRFCKELQKQGRPVIVLVVTASTLERSFSEDPMTFKHVGQLDHVLDIDEAHELGRHLNKFLRVFGKERQQWQWDNFYNEHTIRLLQGFSSFWITLSFWIQGQYDMSESIQEWMYKSFKHNIRDVDLMEAIFKIAAMSSERLPLPVGLLPVSKGELPVTYRLDECRSSIPALGLLPINEGGNRYWALVHDILGRFLINALFYDYPLRKELGFADAKDSDHLRFLLLRQISKKRELGEQAFGTIGENFATFVFKIDPDRGRANFALYWRDVLDALDTMPQPLRNNRVFLHHTAISRRRIAKLNEELYNVRVKDKVALLEQAIADINYALNSIAYTPDSEPNLNLYNSLARAYLDLADVESKRGGTTSRIAELRALANDATRRAYEESPTNSYVVETHVKNLLMNAQSSADRTVEYCIEALGVLFSAISSSAERYRLSALGGLADEALEILFDQEVPDAQDVKPTSATDVLIMAWRILSKDVEYRSGIALSSIPKLNRMRALEMLSHPIGRGNMQVLRLSYQLTCATYPHDFKKQLELLEQLESTEYRVSPQQKLEYAILLYQNNRAKEGDKVFRILRQLWRESDHFVQVPIRLRWLWAEDGVTLKKVTSFVDSDYGFRAMARVQEFVKQAVPFRSEEFSLTNMRLGSKIICHVSFGHNGPFLRPVTAGPE